MIIKLWLLMRVSTSLPVLSTIILTYISSAFVSI
jgi:hypothetical protein